MNRQIQNFAGQWTLVLLGTVFSVASCFAAITSKPKILIPIPQYGFDPTEVAIPWKYMKEAGYSIIFSTPTGSSGNADIRMLTGQDLGPFKAALRATDESIATYHELEQSSEFQQPISYDQIQPENYDAILLSGGHDKGMREYLESKKLQATIADFFTSKKPVGAICHGTLLVGRSNQPGSSKSVLWGRKTTGLTKYQELTAYYMTRWYLGDYYLTYPEITMEDELKSYLKEESDFIHGPGFPIPLTRDSRLKLSNGFTVLDENYLSARWPGDVHKLGKGFVDLVTRTFQLAK